MTSGTRQEICTGASDCECAECLEWTADEELNAEDLEARLEAAWERADERSERQGDLIALFRSQV